MGRSIGYLYYQAGQAVAAVHLGLTIRRISGNPADAPSEIVVPRDNHKARMILWFAGMAAESRGAGKSDPLRRMRNRARLQAFIEDIKSDMKGSPARKIAQIRILRSQAQDRANDISVGLEPAIDQLVECIKRDGMTTGEQVQVIVREFKKQRARRDGHDGHDGHVDGKSHARDGRK